MNEQTGAIQIARILHGGAADRSGLIHIGDEVHEVNGVSVHGKEPDEVVQILVGGTTFLVLSIPEMNYGNPCYFWTKIMTSEIRLHWGR